MDQYIIDYTTENGSIHLHHGFTATITDLRQKQENARYIWNYMNENGWTLESASVVVGAMELVSSLNSAWRPTTSPDSPFGLLGWRFWEFQNWVDAQSEFVSDSDYTIIDNSIGRICWFKKYNLGWNSENYTMQDFSQSHAGLDSLSGDWVNNYVYNTLGINDLISRATYWFDFLSGKKKKNNWKYLYM